MVTNHPFKAMLAKPDHSGQLLKLSDELSKFDISYTPRTTIKAQTLADFLIEFTVDDIEKFKIVPEDDLDSARGWCF